MAVEKKDTYIEMIGRRKNASARVRVTPASKTSITINGQELGKYFPSQLLEKTALSPLSLSQTPQKFHITVRAYGGGIVAQSMAVRHGISRALVAFDRDLRIPIKRLGFLTRDARVKERKKFGLKKARKASQWSKR